MNRFVNKLREHCVPVTYEVVAKTSHASIASEWEKHVGPSHFMTFVQHQCRLLDQQRSASSTVSITQQSASTEPSTVVATPTEEKNA
jgi:predicted phage-related endonuclease